LTTLDGNNVKWNEVKDFEGEYDLDDLVNFW
jgi:hypothetical protein